MAEDQEQKNFCLVHATNRLNQNTFLKKVFSAPRAGFEPATYRLTADCSTIELPGKFYFGKIINRDAITVKTSRVLDHVSL